MATEFKTPADIKWATRQRLQYIEIMAYYTGLVSRSDVAAAFGLSDAAATKDLKLYGQLAPDNLVYRHTVFGFVPSGSFVPLFADLSPHHALPMIAANLPSSGGPVQDAAIYGISVETLPLPLRLPEREVLAQIVRATRNRRKLSLVYLSLSGRTDKQRRIIEPHALINTGQRWHVRAYSQDTYDFRDFVLSRVAEAEMLDEVAESSPQYDDDWSEMVTLQLAPHPQLDEARRLSLQLDYGFEENQLEIQVRRALVGYVLHQLSVDTSREHAMNPSLYHLVLLNRDEIEPFAAWAFN